MTDTDPVVDRTPEQTRARVKQLREELDKLGYHVVKKDWIRKFGSFKAIPDRERFAPHWDKVRPHHIRQLCTELGIGLFHSGAVKVDDETNAITGYSMRAEVSIVLRDPQFDRPSWARLPGDL